MISLQAGPDPKVNFGTSGFDGGQHVEFFEPMKAGDTISAKTQIADVYAKTGRTGTMVFTVQAHHVHQPGRGEEHNHGPHQRQKGPQPMSQVYFEDVEPGYEVGPVVKNPTREQLDAFTTVWGSQTGTLHQRRGRPGRRASPASSCRAT